MDNKQQKLDEFIFELSRTRTKITPENVDSYIERVKEIYAADFRHYYSKVFGTITLIRNDSQYNLQNLTDNVKLIFEAVETGYKNEHYGEEFYQKVKKLYDHINLDIARINYTEKLVNQINEQNSKFSDDLLRINQKAEQMQREYVTILGIFAAIILAFVSGITFSTSVLNNIDKVSIFHLVFITLLIAAMVFNLINFLLSFLRQINHIEPTSNSDLIKNINRSISGALVLDVILWLIANYLI